MELALLSLAQWGGLLVYLEDVFAGAYPPEPKGRSKSAELLFFMQASAHLCIYEEEAKGYGRLSAREFIGDALAYLSKRLALNKQGKRREGVSQSIQDMAQRMRTLAESSNGVIKLTTAAREAEQSLMTALSAQLRYEEFNDFNAHVLYKRKLGDR